MKVDSRILQISSNVALSSTREPQGAKTAGYRRTRPESHELVSRVPVPRGMHNGAMFKHGITAEMLEPRYTEVEGRALR
jgi:hypothetical protein